MDAVKIFAIFPLILVGCEGILLKKYVLALDENIENCAKPEEDAKAWDFSEYEILIESDTETYYNGSFKFTRDFPEPTPMRLYGEKFDRNQWNIMYVDMKRTDFCKSMSNPSEVWYMKMKPRMQGCPVKAGMEWKFDMEPVFDYPVQLTSTMVGKWRFTMEVGPFSDDGNKKMSCIRFHGEIFAM